MKKVIALPILAFIAAIFTLSCAGGSKPESVAKDFLVKLNNQDFKGAALLSTKEGIENVTMLESLMGMTPPEEKAKQKDIAKTKAVKIISSEATGDTAVVSYQLGDGAAQTLNLKKVDGLWKVNFTKGV